MYHRAYVFHFQTHTRILACSILAYAYPGTFWVGVRVTCMLGSRYAMGRRANGSDFDKDLMRLVGCGRYTADPVVH